MPAPLSMEAMVDSPNGEEEVAKVPALSTTSKASPPKKPENPNGRVAEEVGNKEADGELDQSGPIYSNTPETVAQSNNDI